MRVECYLSRTIEAFLFLPLFDLASIIHSPLNVRFQICQTKLQEMCAIQDIWNICTQWKAAAIQHRVFALNISLSCHLAPTTVELLRGKWMDIRPKGLILLGGWLKGPWRAVPVLESCDVSCTSRWQSPGELLRPSDKDGSPLGRDSVLNPPPLGFLKGLLDKMN